VVLLAAGIVAATPAVSAAGPGGTTRVYTASNTALIVLDAATNTVTNQVPLGFQPALRVRPDGTQVYLSDSSGGTIRVLATATNTNVATIGVGARYPGGERPQQRQVSHVADEQRPARCQ